MIEVTYRVTEALNPRGFTIFGTTAFGTGELGALSLTVGVLLATLTLVLSASSGRGLSFCESVSWSLNHYKNIDRLINAVVIRFYYQP